MSTETSTETTSNTETIDGVTVKTDTVVETTVTPDGKVTKKTTTTVTKTDAEGNTTTETNENTEVSEGKPGRGLRALRHHHHATPEEKEQWRQQRKERKEKRLNEIKTHIEEDEKKNVDEFLRLTNEYRQQNGLEALVLNEAITALAKEHNDLMLAFKRNLGHEGFYDRAKKIENSKANAENCGFTTTRGDVLQSLLDQFKNDPPHNKNLLGDYNQVGIAIGQNSRKQWFVTQLFAKIPPQ